MGPNFGALAWDSVRVTLCIQALELGPTRLASTTDASGSKLVSIGIGTATEWAVQSKRLCHPS